MDAGVTFLLEKMEQIGKHYFDLMNDAETELKNLEKDLRTLKAFLVDAAQVQKKTTSFKEMEKQIRDIVYLAEDTVDTCLTHAAEAARPKSKSKIFKNPFKNAPKRLGLAEEVQAVRRQMKPIIEEVNRRTGSGSTTALEQPASNRVMKIQTFRQDNIVGFEDQEKILVDCLLEETEKLDVISIIGMPGLGKTTLAWKICNQNPKIKFEFPTRIWVHVSQDFNLRVVLLNILKEFTSAQDMSNLRDDDLVRTVSMCLENKRFLLVMDDVWSAENWKEIQNVLPMNNGMSKVLLTSRHENVGWRANITRRKTHMLRFLTPEESWELLQIEVFGKLDNCPPELMNKGDLISKQCDGLPLAIVMIGGILVGQFSTKKAMSEILDAWDEVSKNVPKNYIKNISNIVAMSYNNLPADLRDCFLYLGVFPEDYQIPVWTLTRLWIAEGFIQRRDGKSLEETAEDNLKDLINRNLVMVGKTNPNRELKTCQVHDVIREFCISRAAQEQDLFQEIKKSKERVFDLSDRQTYHRFCIHSHLSDFLSELLSGKLKLGQGVRSFLSFYKKPFVLNPKYNTIIPDTFVSLRVLDSMSFKFTEFPKRVTKLIHLRYITLSFDMDLNVLPESFSELWNLQTLVVDTKSRRLEIKADIWKMILLRHLKTKAEIILSIKGDSVGSGGENLQTLSRLSPDCCTEDVLSRARNLKRLAIRGRLATVFGVQSLESLHALENLKLINDLYYESESEKLLPGLPRGNFFPPHIKRLTISATYLDWMHMSTLGMIATLQVLKLKDNAFTGETWKVDGGFGKLQFLLIASTDLVNWEASDLQFPCLTCLVIKNCEQLKEIPLGLAKSLHALEIERVPKSVTMSAKEIEKKKKTQGPQESIWGGFKLTIGPECE